MGALRSVEIFSAGCPVCEQAIRQVREMACPACDVTVLDMQDPDVAERAKLYGVRSIPAVAVDGELAACCPAGGLDEMVLRAAGIGQPL
jgi:hypothetical protein